MSKESVFSKLYRPWESVVLSAENLQGETIAHAGIRDLSVLCTKLIEIYDAPYSAPPELRQRAANAVAKIAAHRGQVLEMVLANAESYAREQHLDDASPYSPNAFDVLAEINPVNERTLLFLHQVVQRDWGVAQWSAVVALRVIQENRPIPSNGSPAHSTDSSWSSNQAYLVADH